MAASGGSGAGGSGGSVNKVGMLLTAGAGLLLLMGGAIIANDPEPDDPEPAPTTQAAEPSAAPKSSATPASATPPATPPLLIDKNGLRGNYPNAIVLTVAAYGLPARVGIQGENDNEVYTRGAFDPAQGLDRACLPQTQHPGPCVYYIVAQRGTSVIVTAGDARAGNWPLLAYLRGAGCNVVGGDGKDHTCRITLGADAELEARFKGSDSRGDRTYPTCPSNGC